MSNNKNPVTNEIPIENKEEKRRTQQPIQDQDEFANKVAQLVIQSIQAVPSKKSMPQSGAIAFLLGDSKSVPVNVSAVILLILVIALLFVLAFPSLPGTNPETIVKYISPLISLILGFIFGKKT